DSGVIRLSEKSAFPAIASFFIAAIALGQGAADRPHDVVERERVRGEVSEGQVPAVVPERPLELWEPEGKRIYHGVCINSENAADFPRRVDRYVELAGHRPAVVVQFAHAFDRDGPLTWDYHAKCLRTIDRQGAIPFLKATTQTWD